MTRAAVDGDGMPPEQESSAGEAPQSAAQYFTRDEVTAAFDRAVGEVEAIAGEDDAIDLIVRLTAAESPGEGPFTAQWVIAGWNAAAETAKDAYNPEDIESNRTIRSDSCGDLIVNLAVGFLRDPERDTDDVIADQWADLQPASFEGFEVWNQHVNHLGDYCPWSGQWATQDNREALMSGLKPDDHLCPQACRASALQDPPRKSDPYKAAIVAEVKEWFS